MAGPSMIVKLPASLGLIVLLWIKFSERSKITIDLDRAYDYIVVGAGSTGSVIANRLSEDGAQRVLVLEAGDDELKFPTLDVPLDHANLAGREIDWAYYTTPQQHHAQGLIGKRLYWPRGKVLGGSSSVNWLVYLRGNPHDFDAWAKNGCEGWTYEEVLPYFMKSEANQNENFVKSGFHGDSGPLVVSDVNVTPMLDYIIKACEEMNITNTDVNGNSQYGFMHNQATWNKGKRWSTAKAFLKPAMERDNLHVATLAHVTRILFEDRKAVGVEYYRDGKKQRVYAKNEVILSAGAIGSTHILLLSGIGPRSQLEDFDIPVISDLPVGHNLQDHVSAGYVQYSVDKPVGVTVELAGSLSSIGQYLLNKTGYLSGTGYEGSFFMKSTTQPPDHAYPYIQVMVLSTLMGNHQDARRVVTKLSHLTEDAFDEIYGSHPNQHGISFIPTLLHTKSVKGYIKMRSSDPFIHPFIEPNFLNDDADIKMLMEAVRFIHRFDNNTILQQLGAQRIRKIPSACAHHPIDSDQYLSCAVRQAPISMFHPAGTCKMGHRDDLTAVVDPQLRVKGVAGLRVADASIMPEIVSANTNAVCIMIGEKAADLILATVRK